MPRDQLRDELVDRALRLDVGRSDLRELIGTEMPLAEKQGLDSLANR